MENFLELGLVPELLQSLTNLGYHKPTAIQAKAIPVAISGRDILGSAQTGTGKTAAFGIPLITKLLENPHSKALVMAPTRELAMQVIKMLESFLHKNNNIKVALLIGGEPIGKQLFQLKNKPRLIVGTPGRINDHLQRGSLRLNEANFLVLDEADRMIDIGFGPQIETILQRMPRERQTLLFSATLPPSVANIAKKYLIDPVHIEIEQTIKPSKNLKQETMHIQESDKYSQLITELNKRDGSIIVFVKTKFSAERIADRLRKENFSADAIHGDLRHSKRERVINSFRKDRFKIMIATDIAARGLDIPHVMHVINYDLPQCAEDYIHRIGRTARAGAEGEALCFISPEDRSKWRAINRLIDPNFKDDRDFKQERAPKKGRGGKKFGQPRGSNGAFGKPRRNRDESDQPRGSNGAFGKPRRNRDESDQPRGSNGAFGKPRRNRDESDQPRGSNGAFGKPRRNRDESDQPRGSNGAFGKPRRNKDESDQPRGSNGAFGKPRRNKDESDQPRENKGGSFFAKRKPSSGKPSSNKTSGNRPVAANRPTRGKFGKRKVS